MVLPKLLVRYILWGSLLLHSIIASSFLVTLAEGFARTSKRVCRQSPSRRATRIRSALQATPSSQTDIQVYDNVVSPLACRIMHCLAVEQSFQSDGETCVFQRNEASTPLECCIDRILAALGDHSQTVEYWSRDEYMNIDAHVDIDENRFLEGEERKNIYCPSTSHVLYLDIEPELRGPTCVFPGKQKGWGKALLPLEDQVELVTVPAVSGRLLRFPGAAMHAVPCPPNRWLLSEKEEFLLRKKEVDEDEDDFDDDVEEIDEEGDEDDYVVERSVLLFNTWPDDGPPPKGERASAFNCGEHEGWEKDYGPHAERIACNPRDTWRQQSVQAIDHTSAVTKTSSSSSSSSSIRVNLMGPRERRIHAKKAAQLGIKNSDVGALQRALHEEKNVLSFTLLAQGEANE